MFSEHYFTSARMVVRDRIKELQTVPAAKIHKIEEKEDGKSVEHVNNCEQDNLVTFLVQIEKMNSGVEKIEENNQKIKETQKHFFDEPSTAGREMYQAEHKSLMKVKSLDNRRYDEIYVDLDSDRCF